VEGKGKKFPRKEIEGKFKVCVVLREIFELMEVLKILEEFRVTQNK
jgi:hypothetical protein